jgi:hypothetical protein
MKDKESNSGILVLGYSNGAVLFKDFNIKKNRLISCMNSIREFETRLISDFINLKNIGEFNSVENVDLFDLYANNHSKFMVLIQNENMLKFALLTRDQKGELAQNLEHINSIKLVKTQEKDLYPHFDPYEFKNFLTRNNFKLIDYKLMSFDHDKNNNMVKFDFILTYENSFIENLSLEINLAQMKFIQNSKEKTLLNNSSDIKFDINSTGALAPSKDAYAFRSTKKIFLSQNNCLLYQIFDFSKSHLVYKKPPQFQINIFKLANTDSTTSVESSEFLKSFFSSNRQIADVADFIWLFKREIYLNNEQFFTVNMSNFLYENINKASSIEVFEAKKEHKNFYFIRQVRILVHLLGEYYETTTLFEKISQVETKEEDLDYQENDEQQEEIEEESDSDNSMSQQNQTSASSTANSIIKSFNYYKSIFRELTLKIFRYYSLDLLLSAFKIDYEKLTTHEKLLVVIHGQFSISKNFFYGLDLAYINEKYSLSLKSVNTIEKWLVEGIGCKLKIKTEETCENSDQNHENLIKMVDNLACDLCGSKFRLDNTNLGLENIECELSGHVVNRCQKTLLPLNSFKFEKCNVCNSKWNTNINHINYPNFEYLRNNLNHLCLFCN